MMTEQHRCPPIAPGRRRLLVLAALATLALAVSASGHTTRAAPVAPAVAAAPAGDTAAAIVALAREAMARYDLRAVILRVTIDGEEVVTAALGESMTGVPATTDMHFRNGAVAISYVSTLLLRLVDQGVLRLDDPLSIWLPELPAADRVTLRMLANMTAGYPDYVTADQFVTENYADPFRSWTPQELIAFGLARPRLFAPGTNWDYAHTNYVILGLALEKATGTPMATLLRQQVLDPLGLTNTVSSDTAAIPEPVLHAFSAERRAALGIAPGTRFYEESTFWDPSWTITHGAIQTTNIYDMTATAVAIGEGTLLSAASHQAQTGPNLLGFGSPLAGCRTCHTLTTEYNYGLGVVRSGDWLLQNPIFDGYGAIEAYLPSKKIAIAVVTTYREESFNEEGNYTHDNVSQQIFAAIGAYLAPDNAPPTSR